jgi:hypothetical protein
MMKHSWFSMSLLLVFGMLGVALAANQSSEYTDATHGFKVRLPTVETPQLPPGLTTVVRFYAPPKNQFAANLGIQIQPWPKGKDLYQDNDVAESQFGSAGFRLLSRKQFKVGDHQALEWISTGQQGDHLLQILTWLVERDEELFILTCTALQATFEDHEKMCRAALNTFGFIDSQ